MAKYSTDQILNSSLENINTLRTELENIGEIRTGIQHTVQESTKLIQEFDTYTNDIREISESYTNKNYDLLKAQIILFQEKIIDLNNRIERIDQIDFQRRFQNITEGFIDDVNQKFIKNFDEFNQIKLGFEQVHTDFIETIKRIKAIDLESHFEKHDQRLSQIFNAINNINSTILNVSNNLSAINDKINNLNAKLESIEANVLSNFIVLKNELEKQNSNLTTLSNQIQENFQQSQDEIVQLQMKQKTYNFVSIGLFIILILLNIILFILK